MTSKTVKTVLFAALLVAMILPFSSMDFANAEQSKNANDKSKQYENSSRDKLKSEIKKLETKKTKSDKDNKDLKILKLVEKWDAAREAGDKEKMHKLSKLITADFSKTKTKALDKAPSSDTTQLSQSGLQQFGQSGMETMSSTIDPSFAPITNISTMGPFYYNGNTESRWNCSNPSDDFGWFYGELTAIGNGGSYVTPTLNYPSNVNESAFPGCGNNSWNSGVVTLDSLTTSADCEIDTFSNSMDIEVKYCSEITAGLFVWIQGQSFYDSGNSNPFSTHASETYLWIWE